jgi:hypothetical protein
MTITIKRFTDHQDVIEAASCWSTLLDEVLAVLRRGAERCPAVSTVVDAKWAAGVSGPQRLTHLANCHESPSSSRM